MEDFDYWSYGGQIDHILCLCNLALNKSAIDLFNAIQEWIKTPLVFIPRQQSEMIKDAITKELAYYMNEKCSLDAANSGLFWLTRNILREKLKYDYLCGQLISNKRLLEHSVGLFVVSRLVYFITTIHYHGNDS